MELAKHVYKQFSLFFSIMPAVSATLFRSISCWFAGSFDNIYTCTNIALLFISAFDLHTFTSALLPGISAYFAEVLQQRCCRGCADHPYGQPPAIKARGCLHSHHRTPVVSRSISH